MNTRANRKVQSDELNFGGRHAVVLGGSLAGLLAARILAEHFEKVTILERDAYLKTTEVRKGIPQAVTPIRTHRATENRLRHFDKASRLPENFLVLGDAACAFNPVYGQGMTIAALGVLTLRECLEEQKRLHGDGSLCGLAQRFQKRLAQVNKAPWLMATGEDYRYREAVGGSPGVITRFMHWYMDRVLRLATRDVEVRSLLLQVFSMLLAPSALFRRVVLLRVLREGIISSRAQSETPQSRSRIKYQIEPHVMKTSLERKTS